MERRSFIERFSAFLAGVFGLDQAQSTTNLRTVQREAGRGHGLVGDGVTDNAAALAALAAGHHVLTPGTYAVNHGTTIPAGVVLEFPKGAMLKLASGIKLFGFEPVAGSWKILDIPRPATATPERRSLSSLVYGWTTVDAMRPEWFGARGDHSLKGNPGADCREAWQQCIETIEMDDGDGPGIRYTGRHRFSGPVYIMRGGFTIQGPGGHDTTNSYHGPPGLYPDADVRCVFDWGGSSDLGSTSAWLVFEDVASFGGSPEATGGRGKRFLEITKMNSEPLQGPTFRNCHISWYDEAMCEVSGAGNPVVVNMAFDGCRFAHVQHALLASASRATGRTTGSVTGFRMLGCYASAGARITCTGHGTISGPVEIANNILEGQSDPIYIEAGLINARIGPNYYEDNSGDALVRIQASNYGSTVEFSKQRRYDTGRITPTRYDLRVNGCRVTARDTPPGRVGISGVGLVEKSDVRGSIIGVPAGETGTFASLDPWDSAGQQLHPSALAAVTKEWTADTTFTPWGPRGTRSQTTYNNPSHAIPLAVSKGQWMVVTLLLRYNDFPGGSGYPAPYIELFSSDHRAVVASAQGTGGAVPGDGWVTVMFVLRAEADSGGMVNLRFNPYQGPKTTGVGCRIGPIGIYTLAAGDALARPWIK